MDLTSLLPTVPGFLAELDEVMDGHTAVACLENPKWLGAFCCVPPILKRLVGAATTEEEGLELVVRHQPSLLFVSQRLEGGTGLSLVARAEAIDRGIRTLLVADDSEITLVREALSYGCDGVCFQSGRFMTALKCIAGGGVYYPESVAEILHQHSVAPPIEALSERELEVLKGMMMGLTDQQISKRLFVSTETVKSHAKNIYQKLGTTNRTQAVVKAISASILSLEDAINDDVVGSIRLKALA